MGNVDELRNLVERFGKNLNYYKDKKNKYNEDSCRAEYIDKLLELLGWDVSNSKGLSPQYREVISEQFSNKIDRPDYTLTLSGVSKLYVEAKKPSVDITKDPDPAIQARKYGWNRKHKIVILTNFEYFVIYDTTTIPHNSDSCIVAMYKRYHYTEYVQYYQEMLDLVSRDSVYSGKFDEFFDSAFSGAGHTTQQVDEYFLEQINQWRLSLSNDLYSKSKADSPYSNLEILNDVVQEFINQIVFLRICEDRNLPLYHKLSETINDRSSMHQELKKLFLDADKRYNSGLFSGQYIIFDLNNSIVEDMIIQLYYPQSPFLFDVIEPNLLGQMYEMFLTEELVVDGNKIILSKKQDFKDRSVVTTPLEIVKYMAIRTTESLCKGKTPTEILKLRIADIACGSGVFLEEVFEQLQTYCIDWYLTNNPSHLVPIPGGQYKLPLEEKQAILVSCIYGVDIDIHAVEIAKFSLLIKLIENETEPSVKTILKILPDLSSNVYHGNSLVDSDKLSGLNVSAQDLASLSPFDWKLNGFEDGFDAIIGNPPYVNTSDMHRLLPEIEVDEIYKNRYESSYKQFDKYFIFIERALELLKPNGYLCYIVPNKFFKNVAGKELRRIITNGSYLVSLDDFGDTQLFDDKTIYSSILSLRKKHQDSFRYSSVTSVSSLRGLKHSDYVVRLSDTIDSNPWRLTTDISFMKFWDSVEARAERITKYANIFNGIQTSAERPKPIYWFSDDEVVQETTSHVIICKDGQHYSIEKSILKPYFKPVSHKEKGLNSYSVLKTDKRIIFPYDKNGELIPIGSMSSIYQGAYQYLKAYYKFLVPKQIDPLGTRDVDRPSADTWYKYGRTQHLTSFVSTKKLIVGVLSKEPMYAFDDKDMLIASGGTAGYCAVSKKDGSPYELEYIQAWLSHPYTEKILSVIGSDFENGFVSRGTAVLKQLPFIALDLNEPAQKQIHDNVVQWTREIYSINDSLSGTLSKNEKSIKQSRKDFLIKQIQDTISIVYELRY